MENKLINFREQMGITQARLAGILDVSRQTIISIEAGKYNPSLDLAFKIAEVFNVKIEDVFIYKGDKDNG